MMNYRLILAIFALVTISACNENTVADTSNRDGSGTSESPIDDEGVDPALVSEAKDFIRANVIATQNDRTDEKGWNHVNTWTPSNLVLEPTHWTWGETQVALSTKSGFVQTFTTRERYAATPAEMSFPVEVDGKAVKFSCRVPDCIRAEKSTRSGRGGPFIETELGEERVSNETRSANYWHFQNENMAQRVAKALNVLIEDAGGQKSNF